LKDKITNISDINKNNYSTEDLKENDIDKNLLEHNSKII